MIRRLMTNPAAVVLIVLAVVSVIAIQWSLGVTMHGNEGMNWSGEPSEEQISQMRLNQIAGAVPALAVVVVVSSVLGVLAIASASRRGSPSR